MQLWFVQNCNTNTEKADQIKKERNMQETKKFVCLFHKAEEKELF